MFWPFLDFAFFVSFVLPRESVDEMFFLLSVGNSVQGTALNSCVYIVDYISESLSVPVIKDWVECAFGVRVRNGMLLFCLAGVVHIDGHLHDSISVHCFCEKEARV